MKLLRLQTMAVVLSWSLLLAGVRDGFAYQGNPSLYSRDHRKLHNKVPNNYSSWWRPSHCIPMDWSLRSCRPQLIRRKQVEAEKWLQQHKNLTGEALAKEVDKQSWDPSVKALTQFPAVLANMNQNLAWTSELGDVYANQQQDVTNAIQTMRQRAQQAGNLKTTPQEKVRTQGQSIVIEPAAPDVVYVPQYDPWLVYGDPLAVFPGWYPYPGLFWDGPGIGFGLGFGIGFFGGFGWGWHNWGFDWRHGGRVVYNHNPYFSHSRTFVNRNGFNHGGFRGGFEGRGGFDNSRAAGGMRSGAFSGFDHGGMARSNSFRGPGPVLVVSAAEASKAAVSAAVAAVSTAEAVEAIGNFPEVTKP